MGEDATLKWGFWNASVVDMDYENMKMVDTLTQHEDCCEDGQNGDPGAKGEYQKELNNAYSEARRKLSDNVGAEQIEACNTATRKLIELRTTVEDDDGDKMSVYAVGISLPLELGITIDGISGIKWGLPLTVDYLPTRYTGNTFFTIIGVDHSLDSSGWTTTLKTVMRTNGKTSLGLGTPPYPPPILEDDPTPVPPPPPKVEEEEPAAQEEPIAEEQTEPTPEPEPEPSGWVGGEIISSGTKTITDCATGNTASRKWEIVKEYTEGLIEGYWFDIDGAQQDISGGHDMDDKDTLKIEIFDEIEDDIDYEEGYEEC
ncbi:hypothetical protein CMI47_15995 [Candidatus Pacearchaeota archaeon]|nr:hypothetical protein [Candidatus Pacearchaeota archaeon]